MTKRSEESGAAAVPEFGGIYPSLPTPFDRDDAVDVAAQRRIVRFALESGAHGLICFGLAGEVFRLTPDERLALLEAIVEEVDGRIPVFAGVGTEAEHTSRGLAAAAARMGADGVVVPPPTTANPGRAELLHYFETIADAAGIPLMVQDAPEYLGVELGPELIEELLPRVENLRLVKLEGGPEVLAHWTGRLAGAVGVFGGNGGIYLLDSLEVGAIGNAPGTDVVDLLVEIFELRETGQYDQARERFCKLLPALVFELQDIDHYNACAKYVLAKRGIIEETHLRAPAFRLAPTGKGLLDRYVEELGLLERSSAH